MKRLLYGTLLLSFSAGNAMDRALIPSALLQRCSEGIINTAVLPRLVLELQNEQQLTMLSKNPTLFDSFSANIHSNATLRSDFEKRTQVVSVMSLVTACTEFATGDMPKALFWITLCCMFAREANEHAYANKRLNTIQAILKDIKPLPIAKD